MGNICGECGVNPVNDVNIDSGLCTDCLDMAAEGNLRPTMVLDFHDQGHSDIRFNPFPTDELENDYET